LTFYAGANSYHEYPNSKRCDQNKWDQPSTDTIKTETVSTTTYTFTYPTVETE